MTIIFNEAPTPPVVESKTNERLDQIEAFCNSLGTTVVMLVEKIEALQQQVNSQPAEIPPAEIPPAENLPAEIPATPTRP